MYWSEQSFNGLGQEDRYSDFLKRSNIYKVWENYAQICCPFQSGVILPIIREITFNKKNVSKSLILESNPECAKRSTVHLLLY